MTTTGSLYLGLDIGGSHATAALLESDTGLLRSGSVRRIAVDAQESYGVVVGAWTTLLGEMRASMDPTTHLAGLAVAMPGPFNYKTGVANLTGLAKFDGLFGANLQAAFRQVMPGVPITFINDAQAFGLGCAARYPDKSLVVLTLGTGLGAAFIRDGQLCTALEDGVPAGGYLYNQPYQRGIIEEFVSARYLIGRFRQLTGCSVANVAELTAHANQQAVDRVFTELGDRLGRFLPPYLLRFGTDRLVIGGGIAHAYNRFSPALIRQLPSAIRVQAEPLTEILNLRGALSHAQQQAEQPRVPYRKTEQFLMPARNEASPAEHKPKTPSAGYTIYPTIHLPDGQITQGVEALLAVIRQYDTVLLDGYVGVLWEPLINALADGLHHVGVTAEFYDVRAALKSEAGIDRLIAPYLGDDDPVFGRICPLDLADFFDPACFVRLQRSTPAGHRIFYGPGAALVDVDAPVVYVDLPKNELQFRARAGSITNLGATEPAGPKVMYKRFYFVDWPVLNRHKKALLSRVVLLVDGQRSDEPTTLSGDAFRAALDQTTRQAFRVRPWFEPGAWGGQWIKKNIAGLNPDAVNYAWSFELIVPENGLVFESGDFLLECSFDWLMFRNNRAVLGDAADRFGDEFPIRFDFLDTIGGGNLSVQCHPRTAYIQEQFGESFTQDETYYMLNADPGAEVYLGFQAGIDEAEFADALRTSFAQNTPIDISQFVQVRPARVHDLFLIPAGTIHCAGAGTLVLEISATPYIYTFKLYDWLRLDLDGKPRPLSIDRGLANLAFNRQGDYVQKHLMAHPVIIQEDTSGRVVHLSTHPEHFYDVHRLEFNGAITVSTNGQCHVLSLVEGKTVIVTTDAGEQVFHYAETVVIPATITSYQLHSPDAALLKVIKAFIKPSALSPP